MCIDTNIYSLASKFRITMYANFFSKEEYQSELIEEVADRTHTEVCFDNGNMSICLDTTTNIESIIHEVLLNFVDKYRGEIIDAFSEDKTYTLDPEEYFIQLRFKVDWLYDMLFTIDTVIVRFQ